MGQLDREAYELLLSAGKRLEEAREADKRNKRDKADTLRAEARALLARRERKLSAAAWTYPAGRA
jgi:hypothetical protein